MQAAATHLSSVTALQVRCDQSFLKKSFLRGRFLFNLAGPRACPPLEDSEVTLAALLSPPSEKGTGAPPPPRTESHAAAPLNQGHFPSDVPRGRGPGGGAHREVCACLLQKTEYSASDNRVTIHTDADTLREQREQRAAVMVGVLIGVFAVCWLPFFTTELLSPLCDCDLPAIWKSLFLWLGYSNSFFNPLIYTAFNKTYKSAFKNLFCRRS